MPVAALRKLRKRKASRSYAVPENLRVYAIGDVHGCLDELNRVLDAVDKDLRSYGGQSHLVFLGDLVDRGPQSAQVIERLLDGGLPTNETTFIMGNHEEAMLACYEGATETYGSWLQFGGVQTLESYGLSRQDIFDPSFNVVDAMRKAVPAAHVRFLNSLQDYLRLGDYVFVHAGIRSGLALEEQSTQDLRWIRRGFLDDDTDHGFKVVHGHTIVPKAEFHQNRIALDTGCYLTGCLTVLALEGSTKRTLTVGPRQ